MVTWSIHQARHRGLFLSRRSSATPTCACSARRELASQFWSGRGVGPIWPQKSRSNRDGSAWILGLMDYSGWNSWLLMILDDFGELLMIFHVFDELLMMFDDFWWCLMVFGWFWDGFWWCLMMILDDVWMVFDDYWWLLMILGIWGWLKSEDSAARNTWESKSKTQDWKFVRHLVAFRIATLVLL